MTNIKSDETLEEIIHKLEWCVEPQYIENLIDKIVRSID